jgi:Co/Zn/Cd efflux system component
MSQNNEEKSFGDSLFFQFLVFGGAAIIWGFVKNTFGITDEEHFGFFGGVAIVFVIALLIAVIIGALAGLLEPHKEKIQKIILIAIILFAVYTIGSIIFNKNNNDSSLNISNQTNLK